MAITNQVFILLVGVPVVVATFLGLAFSPERQAAATVALVLPSATDEADPLVAAVGSIPSLRVVGRFADQASAVALAREGRAGAVVDLRNVRIGPQGPSGPIRVTLDETRPVTAEIVRATLLAWISSTSDAPTELRVDLLRGVNPRDSTIPLWLLISTLSVAMGSVPLLLTDEKEHRTLEALLVTPLGAPWIILAKSVVGTLAILVMGTLMVTFNRTSIDSPALFVVALLVGAASLGSIGLLIGSLAPNQASAAPVASVMLLLLILPVLLGDLEAGPFGTVIQLLPTYQLKVLLTTALFGGSPSLDMIARVAFLAALGLAGGGIATWSLRREPGA